MKVNTLILCSLKKRFVAKATEQIFCLANWYAVRAANIILIMLTV